MLKVENLRTYFKQAEGIVKAVNGVSFDLHKGDVLGIVGETGSGKSVTVKSIMGLIFPPGYIAGGKILFHTDEFSSNGERAYVDLAKLPQEDFTRIRGRHIGMIFQDPMTSLDPMYTIGDQIIETLVWHKNVNEEEAFERAVQMLEKVGIPKPRERMGSYPFELSGGQLQRVVIAIAMSCDPEVLIADEPTTALDVTVQAQILELIKDLIAQYDGSVIFITHDLAVIAEISSSIMVMYGGMQVEMADTQTIFEDPLHPYTIALLNSIPRLDESRELNPIPGQPPTMLNPPEVCPFLPRCNRASEKCEKELPRLIEVEPGHWVRCFPK